MSRPEDIPEDVWDAALSVEIDWSFDGQTGGRAEEQRGREEIARALLAERMAERERCARVVEDNEIVESSDGQYARPRSNGNRAGIAYAAAIRSRPKP